MILGLTGFANKRFFFLATCSPLAGYRNTAHTTANAKSCDISKKNAENVNKKVQNADFKIFFPPSHV
jgi:hypothetical protein